MKKIFLAWILLYSSAVLSAAGGVFPEINGWKLQVDKAVYTADNLWEVIDGAAELFLAYNFQELQQAAYTAENDREVKVELYRHDTPVNTYGMYTAERMPDYTFIDTGTQGYTGKDILNFFTGCYYVKISSYGKNDVDEETLKTIAGEISHNLKQPGSWPAEISIFPEEGKVNMSDGYIATNFMGYSFFRSAFTARYDDGGEFTLFLIHGKTGEADTLLNTYKETVKEAAVEQKGKVTIIQDPYNGKVYLSKKGNYLAGILNAADEATALQYLEKIRLNIPEKQE
jgi:hypothetical protein